MCVSIQSCSHADPPSFDATLTVGFNCSESAVNYVTCDSNIGMLLCRPNGFPVPELSITTEGVDSTSNVDFTSEGEISFTNVTETNAGTYICIATSQKDFRPAERKFRFYVGG